MKSLLKVYTVPSNYFSDIPSAQDTHVCSADGWKWHRDERGCGLFIVCAALHPLSNYREADAAVPARLVWTNTFILVEVTSSIKTLKTALRIETVPSADSVRWWHAGVYRSFVKLGTRMKPHYKKWDSYLMSFIHHCSTDPAAERCALVSLALA